MKYKGRGSRNPIPNSLSAQRYTWHILYDAYVEHAFGRPEGLVDIGVHKYFINTPRIRMCTTPHTWRYNTGACSTKAMDNASLYRIRYPHSGARGTCCMTHITMYSICLGLRASHRHQMHQPVKHFSAKYGFPLKCNEFRRSSTPRSHFDWATKQNNTNTFLHFCNLTITHSRNSTFESRIRRRTRSITRI